MNKIIVALLIPFIISCGTSFKSSWTPEQVKSLGIIENCKDGKESVCKCFVEKVQEKYPDYVEANIKLLNPSNRIDALVTMSDIAKQCGN